MSGYLYRKLAGRCVDGFERGHGTKVHAVVPETHVALCRAKPGRRSAGWSTHEELAVTCARCIKMMARKANQGARAFAAACRGEKA